MTEKEISGQSRLASSVIDTGLCTGCGACVELCPYMRSHRGDTIVLFDCDRSDGRCRQYCPRTATDLESLNKKLFDARDLKSELGVVKGLYMTRAKADDIKARSQHGGTVTALICLAMEEGLIDGCVVAGGEDPLLPKSLTAFNRPEVLAASGSKFGNAPAVAEFNRISAERRGNLGLVATPCQALALAKMRANPAEEDGERLKQLKLVIGLFCGWTLDWRQLREQVFDAAGREKILSLDIPPSRYACMQVTTAHRVIEIPIDRVNDCVRGCCDYCSDMTAEFADISVGSARSKDGWEVDRHWNQVIVRTRDGERLLNLAREKGALEFKEVSPESITKLKAASMGKKTYGESNLKKLKTRLYP